MHCLPGLQSTDGVDLRDVDDGAEGLESSTAALPHLQSTRKKSGIRSAWEPGREALWEAGTNSLKSPIISRALARRLQTRQSGDRSRLRCDISETFPIAYRAELGTVNEIKGTKVLPVGKQGQEEQL